MPRKAIATAVAVSPAPQRRVTHRTTSVEATVPPPPAAATQDDIAKLAYALWQERGCPAGSGEEDWLRAEEQLLSAK